MALLFDKKTIPLCYSHLLQYNILFLSKSFHHTHIAHYFHHQMQTLLEESRIVERSMVTVCYYCIVYLPVSVWEETCPWGNMIRNCTFCTTKPQPNHFDCILTPCTLRHVLKQSTDYTYLFFTHLVTTV